MRAIGIIAGREFGAYLAIPMAYVVTAIFLLLGGSAFSLYLAGSGYSNTSIKGFLDAAPILIILFAAMMSMRLIAEERKLGTWELLLTAPASDAAIVLGKFFGSMALLASMLALTLLYPIMLLVFGDPDLGPIEVVGPAVRVGASPTVLERGAPRLDEHGAAVRAMGWEVFRSLAGRSTWGQRQR